MKTLIKKDYPYSFEYEFKDNLKIKKIDNIADIINNQEDFLFLTIKDPDTNDMLYHKDNNSFTIYYQENEEARKISIKIEAHSMKKFSLYMADASEIKFFKEPNPNYKFYIRINELKKYGFIDYISNIHKRAPFKQGEMVYRLVKGILMEEYAKLSSIILKEDHPTVCSFEESTNIATLNLQDFNTTRQNIIKERNTIINKVTKNFLNQTKNAWIIQGSLPALLPPEEMNYDFQNKRIINEIIGLRNSLFKLLNDKNIIETTLQNFFYKNKILIYNVLGYPVSLSIKEVNIFLKNSIEKNKIDLLNYAKTGQKLGIIEFKSSKKKLLSSSKTTYRKNLKGIFSEVATAVQQCTYYKTLLIQNLANPINNPKLLSVSNGSIFYIDCIVIIGRNSCLKDELSINSFNSYKDSCNVVIKTYDDVLEQLDGLILILEHLSK